MSETPELLREPIRKSDLVAVERRIVTEIGRKGVIGYERLIGRIAGKDLRRQGVVIDGLLFLEEIGLVDRDGPAAGPKAMLRLTKAGKAV